MMNCANCGEPVVESELDADDRCSVCSALFSLQHAMLETAKRRESEPKPSKMFKRHQHYSKPEGEDYNWDELKAK